MELFQELEKFGLEGKKAKVYLALLELGQANIHRIAQKAGIKRTTAYDIVDQLMRDDLARYVKAGKRTLIAAESPEKLKQVFEYKLSALDRLLPELRSFYNLSLTKPKISMFEGKEGILKLYYETLANPEANIYSFTEATGALENLGESAQQYIHSRAKAKIPAWVIAPDTSANRKYQSRDQKELRQTKLIPANQYPFGVEIDMFDQKIAIMSFTKTEMIGVLIESPELYKTMKSIFDLCWNLLPPYKPNQTQ